MDNDSLLPLNFGSKFAYTAKVSQETRDDLEGPKGVGRTQKGIYFIRSWSIRDNIF